MNARGLELKLARGGSCRGTVHVPGSRGGAVPRCSPSSQQIGEPLDRGRVPLMLRGIAGGRDVR